MIPVPSGMRVWLSVGRTDMRRGMKQVARFLFADDFEFAHGNEKRFAKTKGHLASGFIEACLLCHDMNPPSGRRPRALIHISETGDLRVFQTHGLGQLWRRRMVCKRLPRRKHLARNLECMHRWITY
jgi:hypothetical protein